MKQLYVLYQHSMVGELAITKQLQYQFQYHSGWISSPVAFSLSCSLPLQNEAFEHLLSYAFFSNLIPEGDLRYKIAAQLGISDSNDFALLEAIGGEVAGAISLTEKYPDTPYKPSTLQKKLSNNELAQIIKKMDSQPFLVNEENIRLSLAGAQNKLPIIYQNKEFSLPLGETPSTHILKPDPNRSNIPQLAINEAFCMLLAKHCHLDTANIELLTLATHNSLLVQRYDRKNQERLHQEDFCQAMGIVPFNKYENEGGPSFADCSTLISQYSSRPAADKKRLLHWTLFNYLIGNADAHGKNISFLQQPQRIVSPFYDLLSTAIYPELNQRMSMKVGNENRPKWIMERHWQRYCKETQIPFKMLLREAKNLSDLITQKSNSLLVNENFSKNTPTTKKIISIIDERKKWLVSRLDL